MAVPKARDVKLTAEREKVVLVGGYRSGDLLAGEEPLEELGRLAESAGADIVGRVVQNLKQVSPATYIGKGKAEEVRELALVHGAKCILFDHDLQPGQAKTLDQVTGLKVMDRTELILDIFASRARTRAAIVQVGIALLEYRLPRLKRLWTHLERQTGGIGLRGGPGERQMEVDRRKIEKHLYDLRQELKDIEARKERMVRSRARDHYLVSLVGYTNAGKSTLMKALTGEDVLIEDRLFATLDTKTSLLRLGNGVQALLSDTVGFIRRLPHHLVASFHATLEEARTADLLLHVADASSPLVRGQIDAVNNVLKEIGASDRETLLVLNKVDAVSEDVAIDYKLLRSDYPEAIPVSALHSQGLERLKGEIRERARAEAHPLTLSVHAGDGKTLAFLATHFFEDAREMNGEEVVLKGRASRGVLDKLLTMDSAVRIVEGWPQPGAVDPDKY
ncbi:MAG TPA: GTPase HflX [Planctomycetota bacterium]|jgi:GTP-binding protein HflX